MAVIAYTSLHYGLRPVGVSQYPNLSVSWTVHSHLEGFIVKAFCSKRIKIISKVYICVEKEDEKHSISSI